MPPPITANALSGESADMKCLEFLAALYRPDAVQRERPVAGRGCTMERAGRGELWSMVLFIHGVPFTCRLPCVCSSVEVERTIIQEFSRKKQYNTC